MYKNVSALVDLWALDILGIHQTVELLTSVFRVLFYLLESLHTLVWWLCCLVSQTQYQPIALVSKVCTIESCIFFDRTTLKKTGNLVSLCFSPHLCEWHHWTDWCHSACFDNILHFRWTPTPAIASHSFPLSAVSYAWWKSLNAGIGR